MIILILGYLATTGRADETQGSHAEGHGESSDAAHESGGEHGIRYSSVDSIDECLTSAFSAVGLHGVFRTSVSLQAKLKECAHAASEIRTEGDEAHAATVACLTTVTGLVAELGAHATAGAVREAFEVVATPIKVAELSKAIGDCTYAGIERLIYEPLSSALNQVLVDTYGRNPYDPNTNFLGQDVTYGCDYQAAQYPTPGWWRELQVTASTGFIFTEERSVAQMTRECVQTCQNWLRNESERLEGQPRAHENPVCVEKCETDCNACGFSQQTRTETYPGPIGNIQTRTVYPGMCLNAPGWKP